MAFMPLWNGAKQCKDQTEKKTQWSTATVAYKNDIMVQCSDFTFYVYNVHIYECNIKTESCKAGIWKSK